MGSALSWGRKVYNCLQQADARNLANECLYPPLRARDTVPLETLLPSRPQLELLPPAPALCDSVRPQPRELLMQRSGPLLEEPLPAPTLCDSVQLQSQELLIRGLCSKINSVLISFLDRWLITAVCLYDSENVSLFRKSLSQKE